MNRWLAFADRVDGLSRSMAHLARWALLLMLALGLWNVVGRYLGQALGTNLSSNGLIEAQWYLFDAIALLALAHTLRTDHHVRVDVLQSHWTARRRQRLELAGTLGLLLPFVVVMLLVSTEPALMAWRIGEVSPDPGGLPRFWPKALIPLAFALLGLQGIAQAIRLVHGLRLPAHDHDGEA